MPFDITDAPSVLPLEKSPNGLPIAIGLTQLPRTQTRPDGQVTPWQFTSVQTPETQAWPMGHGVVPQDSGLQAPATQTVPIAQEMPTHGRSVHVVIPTQTCIALHVAFGQVGGKHEPFTQTLEP